MKRKYSIRDCQKIAAKRGGKCRSKTMQRVLDPLIWQCSEGHQWKQRFHNIRRGSWCPFCSRKIAGEKRKLTIKKMKETAKERGGKCLSEKYVNAQIELLWECCCGYQWLAKPVNIRSGHWCLKCAHVIPYTKKDLDALAQKNNGECLSSVYKKAKTKYIWQCNQNHIFHKSWDEIQKSWCPRCKGRGRTLEDLHKLAKKRGGKCVSTSFSRMQDRVRWKCANGHEWEAIAASVYRGSWCPKCNNYYTEEMCRFIFESLTAHEFPKVRIRVENESFKLMELDGYSKQLNLAFEHQGIQHYNFVPKFHGTIEKLAKIQEKDRRKKAVCRNRNTKLIVIPFQESRLGGNHLIKLITRHLKARKVAVIGQVDFARFYIQSSLEKLQQIAASKGGRCLEPVYNGPHHKIQWECGKGHLWQASAASVKNNNSWCPICARKRSGIKRRKHSINEMKQVACQRGGSCLSKTYKGTHNNLQWKCSKGHIFEAQVMAVLKGQWCRKCRFPKNSKKT